MARASEGTPTPEVARDNPFDRLQQAGESFPKPLVAAVNGVGAGLGFTILGYCDFTFLAASARLGVPSRSSGFRPKPPAVSCFPSAWVGKTPPGPFWPASGSRPRRWSQSGLGTAVCDDDELLETALAFAIDLAKGSLESLQATKQLMLAPYRDAVAQARRRETASLASLRGPARRTRPPSTPSSHDDDARPPGRDDTGAPGDAIAQLIAVTETYDVDAARREAEPFLNRWGPYRLTSDPITLSDVRRFCEVVEDGNPVYWDEDFAKASRFGRLISPPQSLFAMTFGAWWTPGHVEASLAAHTAALNEGTDAVDSGAIFAICERFGYVVNTVAGTGDRVHRPIRTRGRSDKDALHVHGRLSREDRARGQGRIPDLNH